MSEQSTIEALKQKRRALFDAYCAANANLDFAIDDAETDETINVSEFQEKLIQARNALTEFDDHHPEFRNYI